MPRVTITIPEEAAQPYRFKLDREVVSLGRNDDNDIVIESGSVSGNHAEMRRVHGGYELVDLGSTNGIKLDGEPQQKIILGNDVSVSLGDVDFDFMLEEEELAALAEEKQASAHAAPAKPQLPKAEVARAVRKDRAEKSEEKSEGEPNSLGGALLMGLLFAVLCITTFFVGASIRHQKETGESLYEAILKRSERLEKPAVSGEAAAGQEVAVPDSDSAAGDSAGQADD